MRVSSGRDGGATLRFALLLAAASAALLLAGLAAGSDGWSLAWADEWMLVSEIRAPRSIGAWLAGALLLANLALRRLRSQ